MAFDINKPIACTNPNFTDIIILDKSYKLFLFGSKTEKIMFVIKAKNNIKGQGGESLFFIDEEGKGNGLTFINVPETRKTVGYYHVYQNNIGTVHHTLEDAKAGIFSSAGIIKVTVIQEKNEKGVFVYKSFEVEKAE